MGGTDSEDHKLALYRTSIHSRKWHIRVIFHFLLAAVLNAHIWYKLKNLTQVGDYLYRVGDWVEEAAIQMKDKGLAATRTVRTQAVAVVSAGNAKIVNKNSHWTTRERGRSGLTSGHFQVSHRVDD